MTSSNYVNSKNFQLLLVFPSRGLHIVFCRDREITYRRCLTMNANKAKSIFLHAVEQLGADQWPDYLNTACGDDTELRQAVEGLHRSSSDA